MSKTAGPPFSAKKTLSPWHSVQALAADWSLPGHQEMTMCLDAESMARALVTPPVFE